MLKNKKIYSVLKSCSSIRLPCTYEELKRRYLYLLKSRQIRAWYISVNANAGGAGGVQNYFFIRIMTNTKFQCNLVLFSNTIKYVQKKSVTSVFVSISLAEMSIYFAHFLPFNYIFWKNTNRWSKTDSKFGFSEPKTIL